ncbi:MAG: DUF58 domain-containing protein [Kineosporiaceae bacterium]
MLTTTGRVITGAGAGCLLGGLVLGWQAVTLTGSGLLGAVGLALVLVLRPGQVEIERQVHPDRVAKGNPAILFVTATNPFRRRRGAFVALQRFGTATVEVPVPALAGHASDSRVHHLPTLQRGVHVLPPLEVHRLDPFGLVHRRSVHGREASVRVRPRVLALTGFGAGTSRMLDGPTSDTSPVGTVTFHRLREYEPGDDLRLMHWPTTARLGRPVVRHQVDTSQPSTVLVLDVDVTAYPAQADFEEAVDVLSSVVVAAGTAGGPVQVWTGGATPTSVRGQAVDGLLDLLTQVRTREDAPLDDVLSTIGRGHPGSTLVVVTARPGPAVMARLAALRRRFTRVVLACLDDAAPPAATGVVVLAGPRADDVAQAWNTAARARTLHPRALR